MKAKFVPLLLIFAFIHINFVSGQIPRDTLRLIAKEINKLTFDYNLHYHPMYVQSDRRKEHFYDRIKSEQRYYPKGARKLIQYTPAGQLKSIQYFKKDSLKYEYLYEYENGRLKSERGLYEVDYVHKDRKRSIGLKVGDDRQKFYRASDTIFIIDDKRQYMVRRNINKGLEKTEMFNLQFNGYGEIKQLVVSSNDVKTGQIKNTYDEGGRILEHQHIQSFSAFVNESKWARHFFNSIYTFQYDQNNFWTDLLKETYDPQSRRWIMDAQYFKYQIKKTKSGGYKVIKKIFKAEEQMKEVVITLDEKLNWIEQKDWKSGEERITRREIEYYK